MRTQLLLVTIGLSLADLLYAAGPKPVLWQPPGEITLSDWIWGPGGEQRAPRPPYQFLGEDLNGTNPKIKVRDAKGDRWTVKFGGENHSDVFASRFLHAMGYASEPSYFVASGRITGVHGLKRAKPFVREDGTFAYARFKLRESKKLVRVEGADWSWTDNPFVGTHELNGLKILLMLMSNWDAKDARDGKGSNTAVYEQHGPGGDRLYYAFDDWGATLGKWGGFFSRDKWNVDGFSRQSGDFARSAGGDRIRWGYRGKHVKDITSGIHIGDVEWLLTYLSRVSDEELRAGLRASGATPRQIDSYTRSIRERVTQLQRLPDDAASTR